MRAPLQLASGAVIWLDDARDVPWVRELLDRRQAVVDRYPRFRPDMTVQEAELAIAGWRDAVARYDAHIDAWRLDARSRRPTRKGDPRWPATVV